MVSKLSYVAPSECLWKIQWSLYQTTLFLFFKIVPPEFQVDVKDDQGVKEGKGKMVERSKKVKVVVVLKMYFYDMIQI